MNSVWIVQKISPYSDISALAVSLGAAVRMAKKEEPDADWERISHGGGICGGEGYTLSGKRKLDYPYSGYPYGCQHIFYRFIKRRLPVPREPQPERDDAKRD